MEREKITKSGKLLEADFFPVLASGRKMPVRPKGEKPSSEAQKKYNTARAIKNSIRLINANFDNSDLWITVTYDQKFAPKSLDDAAREMVNYLRRIKTKRVTELKKARKEWAKDKENKRLRDKVKKLTQPMKYYYTIEEIPYQTGSKKGETNYHYHLFLTGGLDRDTIEGMWKKGARVDADRFRPEEFGPEAAARYTSKDPKGRKRFRHSKNLVKPIERAKDGTITARGVEKLAKERVEDREYWERRYKGYRFIRCFPRYNKYNKHWYVSVVMYKTDDEYMPEWSISEDDWITEGIT